VIAQGLDTFIKGKGKDLIDYIEELAEEYIFSTVVIGMPLSMSGNEIKGSERSRALASSIKARIDTEIVFIDERMSSLESERILKQAGRIRDKGDIDKVSAILILQSYLDGVD
jgi:putative Holliday junction resolvase